MSKANSTMPRESLLTNGEKGIILAHAHHGMAHNAISNAIERSRTTITNFLASLNPHQQRKWKPRNKKLSERDVRRVLREAPNTKKSATQIKESLQLTVTPRQIQKLLNSCQHPAYMRKIRARLLQACHKKARLLFARNHLAWGAVNWRLIIFTDEKKFNLDGPDGGCYWHDLRKEREVHFSRQQGGKSVMIWGAISYLGACELEGVEGNQKSTKYCKLLGESLLPFAAETFGESWTLMHDGASTHRSNETKGSLQDHNVSSLDWPAKSLDLNIIENVSGYMVRKVYEDGKQYQDVQVLVNTIVKVWSEISVEYLQKLYKSIPSLLVDVISAKGGMTKY